MIEELYGIDKVEEILMHHSYVGVNLEKLCPMIVPYNRQFQHPPLPPPLPPMTPKVVPEVEVPELSEIDQKVINVLTITDAPTPEAVQETTEKPTTKKKDKKDEKEGEILATCIGRLRNKGFQGLVRWVLIWRPLIRANSPISRRFRSRTSF